MSPICQLRNLSSLLALSLLGCTGSGDDDFKDPPRPENATVSMVLDGLVEESNDTWIYTGSIQQPDWSDCSPSESFYGRYDLGVLSIQPPAFASRAAGTASLNHPSDSFAFDEGFGDRPYLQGTLTIVEWTDARIELAVSDTQLCADKALQDAPMVDCIPGPDGSYIAEAWDVFDDVGEFNRVGESTWLDTDTGHPLCTGSYLAPEDGNTEVEDE